MNDRQLQALKNALHAMLERDYSLAYTYLHLEVEAEEGNRFRDQMFREHMKEAARKFNEGEI